MARVSEQHAATGKEFYNHNVLARKRTYFGVRRSTGVFRPEVKGDLATPGKFSSPPLGSKVCMSGTCGIVQTVILSWLTMAYLLRFEMVGKR